MSTAIDVIKGMVAARGPEETGKAVAVLIGAHIDSIYALLAFVPADVREELARQLHGCAEELETPPCRN